MDPHVFLLVLVAAACHAGWNAAIKLGLEPFSATMLIAVACGVLALPLLAFTGWPIAAAWPWLIGTAVLHIGYYLGLIGGYRAGDMGQVYPIARGAAPLLTATASTLLLHEGLGLTAWAGICLLAAGVLLLSLRGGRELAAFNPRAVGFALATACTICGYSIVDGVGARISGNPHAYTAALFVLNGVVMGAIALAVRGRALVAAASAHWKGALAGGALSVASYWIVIWAMTVAPIAMVAALRETSVLFAALIAVVILKEPLGPIRLGAAGMIVGGLVLIRLG